MSALIYRESFNKNIKVVILGTGVLYKILQVQGWASEGSEEIAILLDRLL
jgi:hypothetical protein